jgi:leader peptidase (prepilin peptidase)/N-methyltransferase
MTLFSFDIFWGAVFFALGLAWGSFANVCIWRIPRGEEVVRTPSHCPDCQSPIKWFDNIPVLSYLTLGGKCRNCGKTISPQYPAVELVSGFLFLTLYLHYGLEPRLAVALIFGWALMVISFIDLKHYIIPDVISLPLLGCGLLAAGLSSAGLPLWLDPLSDGHQGLWVLAESLLGAVLGGGLLILAAWAGKLVFKQEAMGGGDVKLAAAIGAYIGWKALLFAMFAAFLAGSLAGATLILLGRVRARRAVVPFGPFLALGALVALFFGRPALYWYLGQILGR